MILGQSAAMAASLAIDHDTSLQSVEVATLQAQLVTDGQLVEW